MTLADFARQNGIEPATARQWKRRGIIQATETGWQMTDRRHVTAGEFEKMRFPVTTKRDSVTDSVEICRLRDTVTVQQQEIAGLQLEIDALNERVRRVEALTYSLQAKPASNLIRDDWGA